MANYCCNCITIKDTKENINLLEHEFNKAMSKNPRFSDFGADWLGNLLLHIGIDPDAKNAPDVAGYVSYMDKNDDTLIIQTETKWKPQIQCIKTFINKFTTTADIKYVSEEVSSGIFQTNDPNWIGKTLVDYSTGNEELLRLCEESREEPIINVVNRFAEYLDCSPNLTKINKELLKRLSASIDYCHLDFYRNVPLNKVN